MTQSTLASLMLALTLGAATSHTFSSQLPADACPQSDMLIYNANVYTVSDERWRAQALAVKHGLIVFVGSNTDAEAWRPLIERGLSIVAGSDAPVELGDPRVEFYAAITRTRLDGTAGEGWHREYAVSREDALRMFTLWPAHSIFQEHKRGTLSVGKQADLTVFDTDFMTAEPQQILKAKTVMTVVGGRVAFDARQSP